MFRSGLKSQGKFLVKMMTMTLQLANQEQKFMEAMLKLAEVHNGRGVKAIECNIIYYSGLNNYIVFISSMTKNHHHLVLSCVVLCCDVVSRWHRR